MAVTLLRPYGTFATGAIFIVPASFTPPTTFTADVGPIARLYQ